MAWTANLNYRLELNISASCLDAIVNFTFSASNNLTDVYFNRLETKELYQMVSLPCQSKSTQNSMPPPSISPVATAVGQGSVVGGAANSVMSGSPSSFYTLINNLQLLAYLPLSTIPILQNIRSLLASLNMQSFVPNPFLYWVGTSEGPTVPNFAYTTDMQVVYFLQTAE